MFRVSENGNIKFIIGLRWEVAENQAANEEEIGDSGVVLGDQVDDLVGRSLGELAGNLGAFASGGSICEGDQVGAFRDVIRHIAGDRLWVEVHSRIAEQLKPGVGVSDLARWCEHGGIKGAGMCLVYKREASRALLKRSTFVNQSDLRVSGTARGASASSKLRVLSACLDSLMASFLQSSHTDR